MAFGHPGDWAPTARRAIINGFAAGAILNGSPRRKIKPPREFFRGGNFFVRANDVSGFFGEHGGNHLDGFHFHFSRVLPLASSRFFRDLDSNLLDGSDGFALGFFRTPVNKFSMDDRI